MAYDEALADRVREVLGQTRGVTEREMFGGVAFMVAGNMCCGVTGSDLMVRVGPDLHHDALVRPHTREMDFTGVPSKGMVYVSPEGLADDAELDLWVRLGLAYATSLPPKKAAAAKKVAKKQAASAKKKTASAKKKTAPTKKQAASAKKKAAPTKKKTTAQKKAAPAKKKTAPAKKTAKKATKQKATKRRR
jgi:hypothetical protein